MEPITDAEALIQHMTAIFSTMKVPGLDGRIRELSYEAGTVTLDFDVSQSLANPFGFVQGGIVAVLLDGCIGMAGAIKSGGVLGMPLAEIKVSFVRPVLPGLVVGKGETIRLGKSLAFIEGTLFSQSGVVLARASGTAKPSPF
jgi:uncharacterized protein (TIGR00369 family)